MTPCAQAYGKKVAKRLALRQRQVYGAALPKTRALGSCAPPPPKKKNRFVKKISLLKSFPTILNFVIPNQRHRRAFRHLPNTGTYGTVRPGLRHKNCRTPRLSARMGFRRCICYYDMYDLYASSDQLRPYYLKILDNSYILHEKKT